MSAAAPAATGPSNWNLPNALTVLRILLVPVMGVLLVHDGGQDPWWRLGALAVFVLAIATDRIDGEIARRQNLVTDFGKVADPIADKALVGTTLVLLSVLALLPWWITVLVMVREIGITLMRFVVIRHGVMPAGRGGKLKTVLQSVALGFFLFPTELWLGTWAVVIGWVVMAAAVLVTLGTGVDYVAQAVRMRRGSDRTAAKQAARRAGREPRAATPGSRARASAGRGRRGGAHHARHRRVAHHRDGLRHLGAVPGVSAVLRGGLVTYTPATKTALLGVDAELLAARGAVNAPVARQMVAGARRVLGADLAVATTGVAGPGPARQRPRRHRGRGRAGTDGRARRPRAGRRRHPAGGPRGRHRRRARAAAVPLRRLTRRHPARERPGTRSPCERRGAAPGVAPRERKPSGSSRVFPKSRVEVTPNRTQAWPGSGTADGDQRGLGGSRWKREMYVTSSARKGVVDLVLAAAALTGSMAQAATAAAPELALDDGERVVGSRGRPRHAEGRHVGQQRRRRHKAPTCTTASRSTGSTRP